MIVGIDMGGTHIDGAIINNKTIIRTVKNPVDHDDLFATVWGTLQELLIDIDKREIERIQLSTTISTNAIVEDKIAKVGMILESGPGMTYDFSEVGYELNFIDGAIDHRGEIIKDLDRNELNKLKNHYNDLEIEALGIVSKFSTRNPSHEMRIRDIFENDIETITMGHTLSGVLNFPRRVKTSYLNAAVTKTFEKFAQNMKDSLQKEGIEAPIFVLKADGGTTDLETAIIKPVETILSGPAASFMGLHALLPRNDDGILLDIGGTTTDIFFLADGVQLFEPLGIKIDDHDTLVRAIYSDSIGVGGDSYVGIHDGEITVGPMRKDKPVAFGGKYPTPTDAMVVLGYLKEGDKDIAYQALEKYANELRMNVESLSENILETMVLMIKNRVHELLERINQHPVYTIEALLEDETIEPKFMNVIGGPAQVLAPRLKDVFGLEVSYPKRYDVANAIGAALSKPTFELNMHADTDRRILSVPEVELYEPIDRTYTLEKAEQRALELVYEAAVDLGADPNSVEAEIVESSSFNMIKGMFGASKNIRVKAQIKPGLINDLKGDDLDEGKK